MKNAIRVPYYHYFDDVQFHDHLSMLKRYQPALSEITLFVDYSMHGYWPIKEQRELAVLLSKRMKAYRENGFSSVGLDALNTIGHFDEAWDVLPVPPMQTMVGKNGYVSKSCLCPNTEDYRRYIVERYKILASTKPDFIWVDDDFRIGSHGQVGPCYCPTCIAKFNQKYSRNETFETLSQLENIKYDRNETFEILSQAENAVDNTVQREWMCFWVNCYTEISHLIHEAIQSVDPSITIGIMTIPESAVQPWQEALNATKGRPGGGFYYDKSPCDVLYASLRAESQLVKYRNEIVDRQYEFECFPYPDYGKSKTLARLESAVALMSGCNGIAYNVLNNFEVLRTANRKALDMMSEHYAMFSLITEKANSTYNCGIYCTDTFTVGRRLFELGLPITSDPIHASAVVITGHDAQRYSNTQLEKILCGAVLLDGIALQDIIARGLGEYCGVEPCDTYDNGIHEVFTDHPINEDYVGYCHDPFVNYAERTVPISTLKPKSGTVQVLSELYTITNRLLGPAMTLYHNSKGGRVAVMSFFFSDMLHYYGKKAQLTNLFNSIIQGGLPVIFDTMHKLVPIYREREDGAWIFMVANMSFDACEPFSFRVKGKNVIKINDNGLQEAVGTEKNGLTTVQLQSLQSWDFAVFCGN